MVCLLIDIVIILVFIHRGSTFREALLRIGEVHSIIPENIPVMALTATATHNLRTQLAELIGMKKPVMVVISPCKTNIMYSVVTFTSITEISLRCYNN